MQETTNSGYAVGYKDGWQVGSVPLLSMTTCFEAHQSPDEGVTRVSVAPFGGVIAQKTFELSIPAPPVAHSEDFDNPTVAVTRPLEVSLSSPDTIFGYRLAIADEVTDCGADTDGVKCDLTPLNLKQGVQYDVSLQRYFEAETHGVVGEGTITTLKALKLEKATLKDGQTVYDKPKDYRFTFDKELISAEALLEKKVQEGYQQVDSSVSTSGKALIVTPTNELDRESEYRLILQKAESADGSVLADKKQIDFKMSGGPKVTGINIGSTGVATAGTIVITFDQKVSNWKDIAKYVSLSGVVGQPSGSGAQLTVSYSAGTCANFSITVKKGLTSAAGVKQGADWKFNGRTRCYTVQTIGSSEQGRAITAYSFGSGGRIILFTGAIHGNEYSSRDLMYAWVDELDRNFGSIPSGTRVIVVPVINPDGVALGSRYNANRVDLNRNFDTSDWKQDTQTVNGDPLPDGGGTAPASESETQVIAGYTSALRPTLTMSYHAQAAYAIGNQCGNSASKAATYAQLTGYQNMTGVGGAFSYEITGTYDDWICERLGLPSVLIELASQYSAEFSRNRDAMWAMVK